MGDVVGDQEQVGFLIKQNISDYNTLFEFIIHRLVLWLNTIY